VSHIASNILDVIGHTPMVRINRITRGVVSARVVAKLETFNPGNSIKDRMAVKMIEDAEKKGLLKPGGTIIEGTSGNTGMGLAIAAVVKGYQGKTDPGLANGRTLVLKDGRSFYIGSVGGPNDGAEPQ